MTLPINGIHSGGMRKHDSWGCYGITQGQRMSLRGSEAV